jgi:hydroxypyruvate isomerase
VMSPPFRFDVNLSILFTELHLLRRPAAAAAAGFDAVELWWPFSAPIPAARELADLSEALEEAEVALIGMNFDAGDLAAGQRGLLSLPGQEQRFADSVEGAVAFAESQGTRVFNALYGNRLDGVAPQVQDDLALSSLALAAEAAARIGAHVVIETQNHVDSPRYPITTAAQAVGIVKSLRDDGHDNVGFLCDFYHLAMEGADLTAVIDDYLPWIDHVQVADAPGRQEPGTGTIPYAAVLGHLSASGYRGWIGAEHRPSGASAASLAWTNQYQAQ